MKPAIPAMAPITEAALRVPLTGLGHVAQSARNSAKNSVD